MKTSIILIFVCLMIHSSVESQTTTTTTQKTTASTSPVQLGIKAGVNIANIHRDDEVEYDSRTGFHVGGLAHIHLSSNWAVQPEVVFSSQGAELGNTHFKEDYINVPVLIQYMTSGGFRIQTGPQVGFLIAAKNKTDNVEINVKEQLNTVDFSWTLGASYISRTGLGLDVRYNLGISDRTDEEFAPNYPKSTHRVWQIGAFYQFSH